MDSLLPTPSSQDGVRELDPTTVFVGGLDVSESNAWDEHRLRRIFDRFGRVENIHFVRPGASFAVLVVFILD